VVVSEVRAEQPGAVSGPMLPPSLEDWTGG
jgi:hypothetical protein